LTEPERTAFAALSVMPAPFDRGAATSVANCEPDVLDKIVAGNLLAYDQSSDQYDWHDLLREFASSKIDSVKKGVTFLRHADHYAHIACNAEREEYFSVPSDRGPFLGQARFDRSLGHFEIAFLSLEKAPEFKGLLYNFASSVASLGRRNLSPAEIVTWSERELKYARGDSIATPFALEQLAGAYSEVGNYERAISCLREALDLSHGDDRLDRMRVPLLCQQLAYCYERTNDFVSAIGSWKERLASCQQLGWDDFASSAVVHIAEDYTKLHDWQSATDFYELAVSIQGSRADLESRLAECHWELGLRERAIKGMERVIQCYDADSSVMAEIARRKLAKWRQQ
jgi:tetratricopeptide (TPR) repeat protein